MKTTVENAQESQKETVQRVQQEPSNGGSATITDNRPATVTQRKLRSAMGNAEDTSNPIQRKNNTGLPNNLKSGIENLSGYSMDDVKVHYNSSKPAQLQAHAYAQGTDIHLASGQEKHLPHETWHVVQQKQGRVKPTMQFKGRVNINDDVGLEREADIMGVKALQTHRDNGQDMFLRKENSNTVQRREVDTYILRLLFSGSGHNFLSEKRRIEVENNVHQDEAWSTEGGLMVKERLLPITYNTDFEKVEEFDIAGPGAPITNSLGINTGIIDKGSNSIANLRKVIFELVKRKIDENEDKTNKKVKIVGHSRGAVAGAYVAEALKKEFKKEVEVSYSGYDPVPHAKYFFDLGSTTTTDLKDVDKSAVVYAVASGQEGGIDFVKKKLLGEKTQHLFSGIMKPKGLLNSKVIILTSAQHSTNLLGTFVFGVKEVSRFSLVNLPEGVYAEDDWIEMKGGGKRGEAGSYGKITLKKLENETDFDNAYKELKDESKAVPDWGRQNEIKKAAVSVFTNENHT